MTELRILPLAGIPEVQEGDDLAELVAGAVELEATHSVAISAGATRSGASSCG